MPSWHAVELFEEQALQVSCCRQAKPPVLTMLATPAGGTGSIILWGSKGAKDIGLPITVGPKGKVEKGPRGKL